MNMNLDLTVNGSAWAEIAEIVETALETILQKKKGIGHGLDKRLVNFSRVGNGYSLLFEKNIGFRFAVKRCRHRLKNSRRRKILEKNKVEGDFTQTIFVYSKQSLNSIIHRLIDCIKTFFNGNRRRMITSSFRAPYVAY